MTQAMLVPYPLRRSTVDSKSESRAKQMDDVVEKKEETVLDPTIGFVEDIEKQREKKEREAKENDKKEADKKDEEKKAKYVKASKEQQDKARKAWEKANELIRSSGKEVPESLQRQQQSYIERGIEPRHLIGGASDGGPFGEFNADKYKDNPTLFEVAKELKELGKREEVTEEKLNEIKQIVYTMSELGNITEDTRHEFESDINEIIVKNQQSESPEQQQVVTPEAPKPAEVVVSSATATPEAVNGVELTGDMGFEEIRQLLADLSNPNLSQQETMESLKQAGKDLIQPFYEKRDRQDKAKELTDILKTKDPSEMFNRLTPFLDAAVAKRRKNYSEGKVEIAGNEINSIQDLAKFIMNKQDSALYGAFRKYALIDYVKDRETGETKEVFRPDNFLIWVRDQIIQLHDDNRTSEMQPLSAVAIETQVRTVTIYMMNRFRGQYFKDEHTGEIMNDLADSAVNMCYLFGFFRNYDLGYKQVMNSAEKLPDAIVQIHAKNDVTHGDNWATFLSMPDKFGQPVKDAEGRTTSEKDTKVGDAELVANDIYYNISDMEELTDIVGKKSALMTKEGFKKALMLQQIAGGGKYEWDDEPDEKPGIYDKKEDNFYSIDAASGKRVYVFGKDGKLIPKNYQAFINFFNAPTPDKTTVDFVRDLIRLAIAEKVGIESGYSETAQELAARKAEYDKLVGENKKDDADREYKRKVNAGRINAKFAEYSAFIQQRPLMVAARNDVGRRGYDASTKLDINYIIRQSGAGTAGPIGNSEFLKHQLLKNFGVDFVAGLKTENKRSPYEIFREIRHIMNDKTLSNEDREKKKADVLGQLRFQDNAALDYSSNAIKRSYEIFHSVVDAKGLDLDKIVTRTFLEGIKYNTAEFEKQVKDEFIKPMRYAFSSNSALKYGQLYHGFERVKDGVAEYKWKTLADHIFGDEVLDDIRIDAKKNKLKVEMLDENQKVIKKADDMTPEERYKEYLNSQAARGRLVKNLARARLAAELRKHRNRYGPAARWNADMINKFLLALESIKEYTKDSNGNVVQTTNQFFTAEDIAWIRKNSGTGYKSMMLKEGSIGVFKGLTKGLWEGFGDLVKDGLKG